MFSCIELLKNPPAGEEETLIHLIGERVPPGVDEAAYVKAGFLATKVDVANSKFLDNMAEVYGLTYIFNVIPTTNYQGETLPVSTPEKLYNNSGIIFEVYSVQDEEIVASMHLTGDTIGLLGDDGDTNVRDGNVYKNYGKGLRKLMKASRY